MDDASRIDHDRCDLRRCRCLLVVERVSYEEYSPRRSMHRVLESAELIRQDGSLSHASAAWASQAAEAHALTHLADQVGRLADMLAPKPAPRPWAVDDLVWHNPDDQESPSMLVILRYPDERSPGCWHGKVLHSRGFLPPNGRVVVPGSMVLVEEGLPYNHRLDLAD